MAPKNASVTASRVPRRGKKYFTLVEANRSLPYVARIVEDLTASYREAIAIRDRLEHPHPDDAPEKFRSEYDRWMDRLNDLVDELRQVGVELKDLEKGLLDFPAVHHEREIYFCWHKGESTVRAWHEVDAGYAGRQDIALLEHAQ
jgi:hypothetical protein